ncbi:hypothetical protein TASIC1_0013010200 [Trichoderma asperellum]|uniref:Uncharacterized protein n=1 Tax=Trichoderma asperellum TaxID=101201 RepID=A0A6V8R5N6_TRIAP|nr:hypothetical protein TASIC1_0013010200 [Trichoderma asperellum]
MERSSKLAPLTLVSKYYPVANYSYPRSEGAPTPCNSRSPSYKWSREDFFKRSSVDSQPPAPSPLSSPPSLVDDRTDSEASADVDDYRYHTHANELWDSFWITSATKSITDIFGVPKDSRHPVTTAYKPVLEFSATLGCMRGPPLRNGRPPSSPTGSFSSPAHIALQPSGKPSSQGLLARLLEGVSASSYISQLTAIQPHGLSISLASANSATASTTNQLSKSPSSHLSVFKSLST